MSPLGVSLHLFARPWRFSETCPTQPGARTQLFLVAFPYEQPVSAHASDCFRISQTSGIWPGSPVPLMKQPQARHWQQPALVLRLGTSKPSTRSRLLQMASYLVPRGSRQNTGSG